MAAKGGCSASGCDLDDIAEPDYDHLSSLYFDDGDACGNDDSCLKKTEGAAVNQAPSDPPYILGTLVIRVVAARDLKPARNRQNSGLGGLLFGGGGGGYANPYASVQFGTSTQRTTDIYDTLDPVWPRHETMFMDVSLPLSKVTHPDPTTPMAKSEDDVALNFSENGSETSDVCCDSHVRDGNPKPGIVSSLSSSQSFSADSRRTTKNHMDSTESLEVPEPILTVAVFSASEIGKTHKSLYGGGSSDPKHPSKNKQISGDSDDDFLGMTSVDLTSLLTGKQPVVDTWLPLTGGSGSIRIVCEYETTDIAPAKDDLVRFTRFCHPCDLYPVIPGRIYTVLEVVGKDNLLLSYTSPEGWVCSFVVHRFMVLCVERHHGAVEAYREEWQSITERLSHSPLVGTVTNTVQRLPEEGLFAVGTTIFQGGASLLGRWLEGGLDTAVKDVAYATNWDGRFNPGSSTGQPNTTPAAALENSNDNDNANSARETESNLNTAIRTEQLALEKPASAESSNSDKYILPNMPSCPITGEPMLSPVVAADGHTYERAAIARWLQTSDKSPLTGSVLPHKELVPNYGLLSSLQEQAEAVRLKPAPKTSANVSSCELQSNSDSEAVEEVDVNPNRDGTAGEKKSGNAKEAN